MKIIYLIFTSFSIFLIATVLFLKQNTKIILGDEADYNTISVSLAENSPKLEISKAIENIKLLDSQINLKNTKIKKITVIDSNTQLHDLEVAFPGYTKNLSDDEDIQQILNPILNIELIDSLNKVKLIDEIKKINSVSQVFSSSEWSDKIKIFYQLINVILNALLILFFIMLSFLVSFLIRNYLIMSRENIELWTLMGARPHQAFFKYYMSIISQTVIAYFIGITCHMSSVFAIKQKISNYQDFLFLSKQITYIKDENLIIIAMGIIMNLGLSYYLSYKHIIKEHYLND